MKSYLHIFFVFCFIGVFGQTNKKSIEHFIALDSTIHILVENNPELAIIKVNELINLADSLKVDSLSFNSLRLKSEIFSSLGLFDASLQISYLLLKSPNLKMEEKASLLSDIGYKYFQMSDHKKAVEMYNRAKECFIKSSLKVDTLFVNVELGLNMVALSKGQDGIALIKSNLPAIVKLGNRERIAIAIDNLSNAYNEMGDYVNSLKYQLELYNLDGFVNESLLNKTAINQHLAEIYIQLKEYKMAQKHLDMAFEAAKKLNSTDWLFDCYKNQADIDEARGDYKSAIFNHRQYLSLKDSVYKANYDTKMSAMAGIYELQHKESTIQALQLEHELKDAKIQRLTVLVAALVLLIIVIVLLINHRKNKLEKTLWEQFSAQLIQAQETERQRISKELHDSVGQNILFIKSQIHKHFADSNPSLSQSVDNALEEVRSISKDLYPNQLDQYGLISAIDDLCEKIKESTTIFVSSDVQLPEVNLSKETQINCFRIVQECVNNSIKHAKATAIRITGELAGGNFVLIVQDNGVGFEIERVQAKVHRSFGLLNLQERIRLLKGKFDLESAPGRGTKSIFTIPI